MYIKLIEESCLNNKYTKWYLNICKKARDRLILNDRKEAKKLLEYVEGHHILPSCIGTKEQKSDNNNIVFLTFREHIICHLLLTKMFDDKRKFKMQHSCNAFWFKLNKNQLEEKSKINSRTLELLKIEHIKGLKSRSGINSPLFGKPRTEKTKKAMRKPKSNSDNIGKYNRTSEIIKKISTSRIGKGIGVHNAMANPENRAKVSASKIGRKVAINSTTGQRKMVYPNNVPEGFKLKYEIV